MGARINFVFKDSAVGPSLVLYSHWGQTEWEVDIAGTRARKTREHVD